MRRICLIGIAVAMSTAVAAAQPPAPTSGAGCRPDGFGVPVCGEGKTAVRVLDKTTSPSRRFAFAWGTDDGLPAEMPDTDAVATVLVRLADGAVLAKLAGHDWSTGQWRANRQDEVAVWSADSRAVVEIATGRWSTYGLGIHAIGRGDAVTSLDLLPIVDQAVRARAARRVTDIARYDLLVREDPAPRLGRDGRLALAVILHIPKSDRETLDFAVTVAVAPKKGGALAARVVGLRRLASSW